VNERAYGRIECEDIRQGESRDKGWKDIGGREGT
jgi:hypothetical protein